MKILLTGARGFVGRHIARSLRDRGYRVYGLLREGDEPPPAEGREACDLWCQLSELRAQTEVDPFRAIVHIATAYGRDGSLADVVESNLLLPIRLLDFCRAIGCKQFISTDTFFGKSQFSYPFLQAYIRSKREFVGWARLACDADPDLRFSSLRLEHVYGEGDASSKFLPDLIARLQRGQPEIPLTLGDQTRDFIYVRDVAQAYACVLDHAAQLPAGITEYEVGTGCAIPLSQFVNAARVVTGSNSLLCFGALPHRPGEIMASVADNSRLIALGWRPTTSLNEGLRRTAAVGFGGFDQ